MAAHDRVPQMEADGLLQPERPSGVAWSLVRRKVVLHLMRDETAFRDSCSVVVSRDKIKWKLGSEISWKLISIDSFDVDNKGGWLVRCNQGHTRPHEHRRHPLTEIL